MDLYSFLFIFLFLLQIIENIFLLCLFLSVIILVLIPTLRSNNIINKIKVFCKYYLLLHIILFIGYFSELILKSQENHIVRLLFSSFIYFYFIKLL